MTKVKKINKIKARQLIFAITLPIVLLLIIFSSRIYPGIWVSGINLSNQSPEQATNLLKEKITLPTEIILTDPLDKQTFKIPLESIDFRIDFEASVQRAFGLGRTGNPIYDLTTIVNGLFFQKNLGLIIELNEQELTKHLSVVAGQIEIPAHEPSVQVQNNQLIINKGKQGILVDTQNLRLNIGQVLAFAKESSIEIPKTIVDPSLSPEQETQLRQRAQVLMSKSLNLNFEFETFSYHKNELLALINPYEPTSENEAAFSQEALIALGFEIAKAINRKPQNPVFVFRSGKVQEFNPAKDGVIVNQDELQTQLIKTLFALETTEQKSLSLNIPVEVTPPKIQTDQVNNLGIKELIGRGTSRFVGSIASRIYNISLAASRLNGILINPGEVFSFNQALGDISKFTGYKEAYVIQEGRTVLGDGGGVCQVSTTFFRAALDAGLPIIERRAHAYRVGYYEQDSAPGIDATVYAPTTDLKIKNNTPSHILIQTQTNTQTKTLTFEFYGTSDGRQSQISKPIVTNITEPPEDLYIDDPTLPAGTIKQIDWKAWGAKVNFIYTVTKNGENIYQKTFYSNYQPWQAKFLRGIGPV